MIATTREVYQETVSLLETDDEAVAIGYPDGPEGDGWVVIGCSTGTGHTRVVWMREVPAPVSLDASPEEDLASVVQALSGAASHVRRLLDVWPSLRERDRLMLRADLKCLGAA